MYVCMLHKSFVNSEFGFADIANSFKTILSRFTILTHENEKVKKKFYEIA